MTYTGIVVEVRRYYLTCILLLWLFYLTDVFVPTLLTHTYVGWLLLRAAPFSWFI